MNADDDPWADERWSAHRGLLREYMFAGAVFRTLAHFETAMVMLCLSGRRLSDAEWLHVVRRGLSD